MNEAVKAFLFCDFANPEARLRLGWPLSIINITSYFLPAVDPEHPIWIFTNNVSNRSKQQVGKAKVKPFPLLSSMLLYAINICQALMSVSYKKYILYIKRIKPVLGLAQLSKIFCKYNFSKHLTGNSTALPFYPLLDKTDHIMLVLRSPAYWHSPTSTLT